MYQHEELEQIKKLLLDLTMLGHFDQIFMVPGREKTHKIRIGTLWEDDLIRIKKRASTQSSDFNTQQEIIVFETLVEAIMEIDGFKFYHESDTDQTDQFKGQLREILKASSPYMITNLYKRYAQLTNKGASAIEERIEEIKKSSGPSQTEEPTPPSLE